MRGNTDRLKTSNYRDDALICCKLAITACELEPLSNRRLHCVRYAFLFSFTFKGAIIRRTLLALSVLAGLAGGTAATPADAAPLAHGLLPSVDALLPVANTATYAALNEGASVQTVRYFRRYRRYGRRSYYGRRHYSRY
jgi:hypothetical protein